MKKLAKVARKDDIPELKRQNVKFKRDASAKVKKLELRMLKQKEEIQRKGREIQRLKTEVEKKGKDLSKLKKESSCKIRELESKIAEAIEELEKSYKELHVSPSFPRSRLYFSA